MPYSAPSPQMTPLLSAYFKKILLEQKYTILEDRYTRARSTQETRYVIHMSQSVLCGVVQFVCNFNPTMTVYGSHCTALVTH